MTDQGLTSNSTHNSSFRRRVFPGNRLHWYMYWQPSTITMCNSNHYVVRFHLFSAAVQYCKGRFINASLWLCEQRRNTLNTKTSPNTNKLAIVNTKTQNLKQFTCKNCSYQCAYDCTQSKIVLHSIAQNSSDNLPFYHPDNHDSSDVVWWRGGAVTEVCRSRNFNPLPVCRSTDG